MESTPPSNASQGDPADQRYPSTPAPDATPPLPPSAEVDAQTSKEDDPSATRENTATPQFFSFRRLYDQARQVDGSLRHAEHTLQQSRQNLGDLRAALEATFPSGADSQDQAFQSMTIAHDALVTELETLRETVSRHESERDGLRNDLSQKELECDGLDQLSRTQEAELHLLRAKADMLVHEVAVCERRSLDHDMHVAGQRQQLEAEKKQLWELQAQLKKDRDRLTDDVNAVRAHEARVLLHATQVQYPDPIEPPPFRGSTTPTGATRSIIPPALPIQAPPSTPATYSADTMQTALLYQRREAQARMDQAVGQRDETIQSLSRTIEDLRSELREAQQQASRSGHDPQLRDDCARYRRERDASRQEAERHRTDLGVAEEELRIKTRQCDKLESYTEALEEERRRLEADRAKAREDEKKAVAALRKTDETLRELQRRVQVPTASPALSIEAASLRSQLGQLRAEAANHRTEALSLRRDLIRQQQTIQEQDGRLVAAREDKERIAREVAREMSAITDKYEVLEQLIRAELEDQKTENATVQKQLQEKLDKVGRLLKMSEVEKGELAKDLRRAVQERGIMDRHFRDVVPLWWDWVCSHFSVKGPFELLLEGWVQDNATKFVQEEVNVTVYSLPSNTTPEPFLGRFFGRDYRQCVGSNQLPVEVESSPDSPDPTPPSSPDSISAGATPSSSLAPPGPSSGTGSPSTTQPSSSTKRSTTDPESPTGTPLRKKSRKDGTPQSSDSPQLPVSVVAAYDALVAAQPWTHPRPSFIPAAYLSDPLYRDLQASLEAFWANAGEAHWRRRYMADSLRNERDSDPVKRYLVAILGCLHRIVKRGESADAHPGDRGLLPFLCYPHTFWPVFLRFGVSLSRMVSGMGVDAACEYLQTQGHSDWPVVPPLVTQKLTKPFVPPVFASVEFVSKSVRDFHTGHFDPGANVRPDKAAILDAARELLEKAEHFVRNFGRGTTWATSYDFVLDPAAPSPDSQWSMGLSPPPGVLPVPSQLSDSFPEDDEEKED